MTNIFLLSDTHFTHKNILTFTKHDETPLRTFTSVEEMDEHMIECWNNVVGNNDLVYHCGDITMHERYLPILNRLKGRKILIRGNHDLASTKTLLKYFEEVYATYAFKNMILSHMPIDRNSVTPRYKVNVHGHLHAYSMEDPLYFNVSVEQLNYTPISLEEVRKLTNCMEKDKI